MTNVAELVYLALLIVLIGTVIKDNIFFDRTRKEIRGLRSEVRRLTGMLNEDRYLQERRRITRCGRNPFRYAAMKKTGSTEKTEIKTLSPTSETEISS